MPDGFMFLNAAALALLTLEALKFVVRKWVVKNPEYTFPVLFYDLLVPFFTFVWGGLKFTETGVYYVLGLSWPFVVQWVLAILVELGLYNAAVKPYKEFRNGS